MKKLVAVAVTTVVLGLSANVQADTHIDTHLEKQLIQVCEALRSNDRLTLHKAIKASRMQYSAVAEGLRCNGLDAISFALEHNANLTAGHVAKRANVSIDAMLAKR